MQDNRLLRLKDVCVHRQGKVILEKVSIDIFSNKIVTLIGPNGAGKSTLAKAILGLINPTSGVISKEDDLKLGYVPQKFHVDKLIPITVKRFLHLYAAPIEKLYKKNIKLLKLAELENSLLYSLSGGEMQRVLIAQSLMGEPDLLVLDEPAQGMDIWAQSELYDLLQLVKSEYKLGIFIISHDLHFVMQGTDEVVCLNKHICCHGEPEHVQKQAEYLKAFGIKPGSMSMYVHHHDHTHHFSGEITDE